LYLGRFEAWDVLGLGCFVLGRFFLGRLVLGRFIGALHFMHVVDSDVTDITRIMKDEKSGFSKGCVR
jgi:hypothetical protein